MIASDTQDRIDPGGWLDDLADVALKTHPADSLSVLSPPLDRVRPERRPLIPRAVWIGLAAVLVVVAAIVGIFAVGTARSEVAVPDITGMDLGVARTSLSRVGLSLVVAERRFSTAPEDVVLEQRPRPGQMADGAGRVEVVVSAGTEELVMPDVIGDGISLASGALEGLGLTVQVERIVSSAPSDTVLSSVPAAGAAVRTGDTVRLQVASPRNASVDLRPFRLSGVTVVIDPSPVPRGVSGDPAFEVGRRLEAMLSASEARVVVTRGALDTGTVDALRAKRAREASPTVCIGLAVAGSGEGGRIVSIPPSRTIGIGAAASKFGGTVESALADAAGPVRRSESSYDAVLTPTGVAWVRVLVGSASDRDDMTFFADPGWSDRVARALYTALGEAYGKEVTP